MAKIERLPASFQGCGEIALAQPGFGQKAVDPRTIEPASLLGDLKGLKQVRFALSVPADPNLRPTQIAQR